MPNLYFSYEKAPTKGPDCMPTGSLDNTTSSWKKHELLLFRFCLLYFTIHLLPLDRQFWESLATIVQHPLDHISLFNLANYTPHFFAGTPGYNDWALIAGIALIGSLLWTWLDKGRTPHYTRWYYWLRVALRYRLSMALLSYGMLLFFLLWAPAPTRSQLNTAYGDFTLWQLFVISLGAAPFYQLFLGLSALIIGLLLLYRKTVPFAALSALIFLGNVHISNLAYKGSEAVYSLFLISIAVFLLQYDGQRLFCLLVLQRPTAPASFTTVTLSRKQQLVNIALKACFLLFFVALYGFTTGREYYRTSIYREVYDTALPGLPGLYEVTEFRINQIAHPYSTTDTMRWQDVVFERWDTLSIRMNGLTKLSGRQYYRYTTDSAQHLLTLYPSLTDTTRLPLVLHYEHLPPGQLLLTGRGAGNDSITVLLTKSNKKYLLYEAARKGRRGGLKL